MHLKSLHVAVLLGTEWRIEAQCMLSHRSPVDIWIHRVGETPILELERIAKEMSGIDDLALVKTAESSAYVMLEFKLVSTLTNVLRCLLQIIVRLHRQDETVEVLDCSVT